jgi:hypothetical protein
MKFDAVRSASRKFLVTRETMSVFPSLPAFARLLEADIGLHRAIDPDEKKPLWALIAIRLLRLTVVGLSLLHAGIIDRLILVERL